MKTIAVCVDFSPLTEAILLVVEELARPLGAEVHVVHVAPPEPEFVGYSVGPNTVRDSVAHELRHEHQAIEDLARDLRVKGLSAHPHLLRGPTIDTIVAWCNKHHPSLVVAGSHGHNALFELLAGSVTRGLLQSSPVPVLVVPDTRRPRLPHMSQPIPLPSKRSPDAPPSLSLGTMNFGRRTPEPEARRVIARALERGVSLVDTANLYADGESERIIGKALEGRRDQVLLASKVGLARKGKRSEGLSRATIVEACEASLSRLRTSHLDIYYLHAPDPETPLDSTLDGLDALLSAGKIRSYAVSNHASWQTLELGLAAQARGLPRPVASQVLYNALVRQIEIEHTAFCTQHRLHLTVYNPLAGGLLVGNRRDGNTKGGRFDSNPMYRRRYYSDPLLDLVDRLAPIAEAQGRSLVSLSYGWLASRPAVDSIIAGPATVAHLDDVLDALSTPLPPDAVTAIDDAHRAYLGTDASYAR